MKASSRSLCKQTVFCWGAAAAAVFGRASADVTAVPDCSYLIPHRPCVSSDLPDQNNVYTQLSFLYWGCGERGLDFALKNKTSQADSRISVHEPSFKWDPAFRFIVGYHLPHDSWNLDFTYSLFYQHVDTHVDNAISAFGQGILSVWTSPQAFASGNIFSRWQEASAKWKIHAHLFDLMLRHDLWLGQALSFQPACGLKFALLQQRYNVMYAPGNTVDPETFLRSSINMNNRSLNVGPNVSCRTQWCLSPNWNLFSALSGALLGSHFHVGRNESDSSYINQTLIGSFRESDRYWTYRPQGTFALGVQWADCDCHKTRALHYALSASYEAQYWWKQNMLLRHYDAPDVQSQTLAPTKGDLFFHGLTVDLLLDF